MRNNYQITINRLRAKRGFTLIEMLLYTGLLSIFLLILTQVFTSSLDAQLESQATSSVEQDARFIFARLAYDIENADSLVLPALPGDTSEALTLTRAGQSLTYSLVDDNLVITDSVTSDLINSYATSVSALSFLRIGNVDGKNNVKVSYTLESKTTRGGNIETRSFETTLGTR